MNEPEPDADGEGRRPEEGDEVRVAGAVDRRTVRRAPRYGRFVVAGIILGGVLAYLLSGVPPSPEAVRTGQVVGRSDLFWLLFLTCGFFGGIGGAVLALVVDRVSLRSRARRMRRLEAERDGGTPREEES
ncbi:hypothetical protein [Georgenia alba]|uniref:DUF1049 domain-containing protein n=1 Tax=Georgenia alba TaxID=2233858 RepID=A0ABW2QCG0_9MICO